MMHNYAWSTRRAGLSLLEVLIVLLLAGAVLGPLVGSFISSERIGFSAERLLEATIRGEAMLEALLELEVADVPAPARVDEVTIWDDDGSYLAGSTPRWQRLLDLFASSLPTDSEGFRPRRRVTMSPLPQAHFVPSTSTADELRQFLVVVHVSWERLPGKPGTRMGVDHVGVLSEEYW